MSEVYTCHACKDQGFTVKLGPGRRVRQIACDCAAGRLWREAHTIAPGWKSAVSDPPPHEYATYLVITRCGDPHTRQMIVWSYQKVFDRPIEHCAYARYWGHANGIGEAVEYYHELPIFTGVHE